jgi:hypothetical protein
VLTVILLLLMWPVVATFFRIVVFKTRPSSAPEGTAARVVRDKGREPTGLMINPTQPQAVQYVVTRYAWADIWPALGRVGRLELHKTTAAIGLCCTIIALGAAIFCIWFPVRLS